VFSRKSSDLSVLKSQPSVLAGPNLIRFRQFHLDFPNTLIRATASNIFKTLCGISDDDMAGKAIVRTVAALLPCEIRRTLSGIFQTLSEISGTSLLIFRSAQLCENAAPILMTNHVTMLVALLIAHARAGS
jgi:hypothetical protein